MVLLVFAMKGFDGGFLGGRVGVYIGEGRGNG